mgnify:CR=1 FL=1|jgi:hypothetical protein
MDHVGMQFLSNLRSYFNFFAMNSMLSQKLNMRYDEGELWIMNLVRNSKLDAKIDSVSGTLIMTTNHVNM